MTTIQRFHTGSRLGEATVHHGTAHLAGQVAADAKQDIASQTRQVLPSSLGVGENTSR